MARRYRDHTLAAILDLGDGVRCIDQQLSTTWLNSPSSTDTIGSGCRSR